MTREELLNRFGQVVGNPAAWLRQWQKESGKQLIGCHLTDAPEELILAADLEPVVVPGACLSTGQADARLPAFCCSVAKSCLELELRGSLDFMAGFIFPHICDSVQQLSAIWHCHTRKAYQEDFLLPRAPSNIPSLEYTVAELNRIREGLERFAGKPITDEAIWQSIKLMNENRALLREIWQRRLDQPGSISNRELYTLVKSSMFTPKSVHTAWLRDLLAGFQGRPMRAAPATRIFLSGILWEPPELMDIIEELGGLVVGDDLYTGWRYIESSVEEYGDPMAALAKRQLRRIPSACTHHPDDGRAAYLLKRAEELRIRGLIFLQVKFCEPEDFDYPDLKAALEEAGYPTLRLELELQSLGMGPLRTRLQAFFEMLL